MNRRLLATVLLAGLVTGPAWADTTPFVATCTDVKAYGYRLTDLGQGKSEGTWQDWGSFGRPWRFAYSGGERILIDDKEGVVLFAEGPKLLVVEISSNAIAASGWTFAFRLDQGKAVATKTNVSSAGLQAVSVELECTLGAAP